MDRFRIAALEKILGSGVLNEEQAQQAQSMLNRKARIFAAGARKRGREEAALRYEAKIRDSGTQTEQL